MSNNAVDMKTKLEKVNGKTEKENDLVATSSVAVNPISLVQTYIEVVMKYNELIGICNSILMIAHLNAVNTPRTQNRIPSVEECANSCNFKHNYSLLLNNYINYIAKLKSLCDEKKVEEALKLALDLKEEIDANIKSLTEYYNSELSLQLGAAPSQIQKLQQEQQSNNNSSNNASNSNNSNSSASQSMVVKSENSGQSQSQSVQGISPVQLYQFSIAQAAQAMPMVQTIPLLTPVITLGMLNQNYLQMQNSGNTTNNQGIQREEASSSYQSLRTIQANRDKTKSKRKAHTPYNS